MAAHGPQNNFPGVRGKNLPDKSASAQVDHQIKANGWQICVTVGDGQSAKRDDAANGKENDDKPQPAHRNGGAAPPQGKRQRVK